MATTIQLTPEQSEQLKQAGNPPAVRDPQSNRRYILLTEEMYIRLFEVDEHDEEQRNLRRASTRGAARRLADEEE